MPAREVKRLPMVAIIIEGERHCAMNCPLMPVRGDCRGGVTENPARLTFDGGPELYRRTSWCMQEAK